MDGSERRGGARRSSAAVLQPTSLDRRFPQHLRESRLILPSETVVVALSGGLDSVVLLHLLHFHLRSWNLRLVAAHFDHRMREGSDADADWVAGLCRAWGVPLERGVAERPLRGEAEAREARYRFLHAVAERHGAHRVATAHHADDQAETVLFRIIRGTGLRGLAGIPARRGKLVRPLLPFWRAELLAYARAARLRYREDPTNWSLSYARNRLRHDVLPRLEAIAPGAARALVRLAEHARTAEEAWDWVLERLEPEALVAEASGEIVLARPVLLSYHPEIRTRMLRRALRRLGGVPDRAGTRAMVEFINSGASGAQIHLAGGIRVERELDRIRILRIPREAGPVAGDRPLVIEQAGSGEGEAVIGGRRFNVRWGAGQEEGAAAAAFRLSDLRFPLEVRAWRPGDRIRLPYGTKKLKKLFLEHRIGRSERARVPVLAEAGGRILWVVGVARAALAAPRPGEPSFQIVVEEAAP